MSEQPDRDDPVVGLVMGSDSDWPVMSLAAEALEEFGVAYEADVVSAHRMPADMIAYGSEAAERGLRVIVAGAGGAAHLPGMLASVTPLPVIGVPVPLAHLDGLDSLLSIVQMPAGVPVATVSIGGARNAGLLAVRILAAGEGAQARRLREQMRDFQGRLRDQALAKGRRCARPGGRRLWRKAAVVVQVGSNCCRFMALLPTCPSLGGLGHGAQLGVLDLRAPVHDDVEPGCLRLGRPPPRR